MSTALELTRKGWRRYLEAARCRARPPELTPAETHEREQLLSRIREAANMLKKRFGVRRVVLFGSFAHSAWFVRDSDVDLAVEGLEGDDYWDAWGMLEDVLKDRPVDLIDIETASESLQKAIRRFGIEL